MKGETGSAEREGRCEIVVREISSALSGLSSELPGNKISLRAKNERLWRFVKWRLKCFHRIHVIIEVKNLEGVEFANVKTVVETAILTLIKVYGWGIRQSFREDLKKKED